MGRKTRFATVRIVFFLSRNTTEIFVYYYKTLFCLHLAKCIGPEMIFQAVQKILSGIHTSKTFVGKCLASN